MVARINRWEILRTPPRSLPKWCNSNRTTGRRITLSQVLLRLNKPDEANQALAQHQKINAGKAGQITDPAVFEKSEYTKIRAPFELEQPDPKGIAVTFADVTAKAFGGAAQNYSGPWE